MTVKRVGNGTEPIDLGFTFTDEGGFAIYLINKTGAASVKGTLVDTKASIDNAVNIVGADEPDIVGVVYENGIADGDLVLVVISGVAEVLLEDSTASTRGYWARISITQNGRADITNAAPPGGGVAEIDRHFREIGHCLESKGAGTDVLAKCILHFN